MTEIERIEHTEPGYDCEYGPCVVPGCAGYGKPGRPGGGHGIHGDGSKQTSLAPIGYERAQAETFWVPLEQRLVKEVASLASDPSWVTRRFQNLEKK